MKIARDTRARADFRRSPFLAAGLLAPLARASNIALTPEQRKALDTIYQGDPDGAIVLARAIQQAAPQQPEGYVIESEALWWKRYCGACEIKYGMIEAWTHEKRPEDEAYLELADRIVELAKAQLAKSETAEMHFFVGMGYALKVRVYGLRSESRNAARAAVNARVRDAARARARSGVGGRNRRDGSLQLLRRYALARRQIPSLLYGHSGRQQGTRGEADGNRNESGPVLAVHVRFILARALRQYDQKYEEALGIAEPLVARYPQNPLFLLLAGNLNAELGRNAKAAEYFRQAAERATIRFVMPGANAQPGKLVPSNAALIFAGFHPQSDAGGFFLFEGVIRGANQRAGFHVLESHLFAEALEFGEFIRMDVALDRQVFGRWLQILTQRQDVRPLRRDFFHGVQDFVARLAEAQHHAGFRRHLRRHVRARGAAIRANARRPRLCARGDRAAGPFPYCD